MRDVKKALGLEPANGKIEAAFIPRSECGLKEQRMEERLSICEKSVEDHEHRIVGMAQSARLGAQILPWLALGCRSPQRQLACGPLWSYPHRC